MKFLIFSDQPKFDTVLARLNEALGFPCRHSKTSTLTEPITHEDGRVAMALPDFSLEFLTDPETVALVDGLDASWNWPPKMPAY